MLIQSLLVGLAVTIGAADYFVGTAMIERPIVLGSLVGIFFGDVSTGVTVGFQLELAFMGVQMVGAAVPPNVVVGSVLGTAFAITMGSGADTALTIAMPAAILASLLDSLFYGVVTPVWANRADRCAADDNPRGICMVMFSNGVFRVVAMGLIAGAAFMFGADAVQTFVNAIPGWLTSGITIATGVLPALGFAQLVTMISSRELAVFFFFGFLLSSYLSVPVIGIVCFSIVAVGVLMMVHIFVPQAQIAKERISDDNEF